MANREPIGIGNKRGRAVYRVAFEKPGKDGAPVVRHEFQIDDAIPVFAEDVAWTDARLRGE